MPLIIADLAAAVANADASPAIPGPYNGSLGTVDMSKPIDYTGDWGKICIDAGNYDLPETMRYYIWLAQGKPGGATPMTQEHMDKAVKWVRIAIARERILTLVTKATINIGFRQNDIIPPVTVPNGGVTDRVLRELYNMLVDGEAMDAHIAEEGRSLLFALIANAVHRAQNNGHSWFTKKTNDPSSLTHKACAVAAEDRDAFVAYMLSHGHDVWHFLPDSVLEVIALALVGKEAPVMRIPPAPAGGGGAVPGPNDLYAGVDVRGKRLSEFIKLPESCADRYPPGELGKAALIVGLGFIGTMINSVATKVKIAGADSVAANMNALAGDVRTNNLGRPLLKDIENLLGPMLSFAHGYAVEMGTLEMEKFIAYDKHSARFASDNADGKTLAQVMKEVTPHPEAVASAIANMINRIGTATNSIRTVGGATPVMGGLPEHTVADVAIEVAKTENAKTLDLIAAINKVKI